MFELFANAEESRRCPIIKLKVRTTSRTKTPLGAYPEAHLGPPQTGPALVLDHLRQSHRNSRAAASQFSVKEEIRI
jgi:hypothetical protein